MKKGDEATTSQVIIKFSATYRTTPILTVPGGKSLADVMFDRSIRTIFNTMLPPKVVDVHRRDTNIRSFKVGDSVRQVISREKSMGTRSSCTKIGKSFA